MLLSSFCKLYLKVGSRFSNIVGAMQVPVRCCDVPGLRQQGAWLCSLKGACSRAAKPVSRLSYLKKFRLSCLRGLGFRTYSLRLMFCFKVKQPRCHPQAPPPAISAPGHLRGAAAAEASGTAAAGAGGATAAEAAGAATAGAASQLHPHGLRPNSRRLF